MFPPLTDESERGVREWHNHRVLRHCVLGLSDQRKWMRGQRRNSGQALLGLRGGVSWSLKWDGGGWISGYWSVDWTDSLKKKKNIIFLTFLLDKVLEVDLLG